MQHSMTFEKLINWSVFVYEHALHRDQSIDIRNISSLHKSTKASHNPMVHKVKYMGHSGVYMIGQEGASNA